MSTSMPMFWLIATCAIVTILPRILPFALVRGVKLPAPVLKWLSYVPLVLLTALIVEGMLVQEEGALGLNWQGLIALVPTAAVALWTRSLSATVIVGVLAMALVRLLL